MRLLLVHGVGNPQSGEVVRAAGPLARAFGVEPAQVEEFNWNAIVGESDSVLALTPAAVTAVSRATLRSAFAGFSIDPGSPAIAQLALRVSSWLAGALVVAWPVAILAVLVRLAMDPDHSPLVALRALIIPLALALASVATLIAAQDRALIASGLRRVVQILLWPVLGTLMFTMVYVGLAIVASLAVLGGTIWVVLMWLQKQSSAAELQMVPMRIIGNASLGDDLVIAICLLFLGSIFMSGWVRNTFVWVNDAARHGPAYVIKIVADVVRYIGEEEYRERLLGAFLAKLDECAQTEKDLLIVAHSLGTVITVDALCRWQGGRPGPRISLITYADPQNRWFARWFPTLFVRAGELLPFLRSERNVRDWVNLCRPMDPFGSLLGLRAEMHGTDVRQPGWGWSHLLGAAHVNYWSDPAVIRATVASLESLSAVERRSLRKPAVPRHWVWGMMQPPRPWIISGTKALWTRRVALWLVATAMITIVAWVGIFSELKWATELDEARPELSEQGLVVAGRLCLHYEDFHSTGMGTIDGTSENVTLTFPTTPPDSIEIRLKTDYYDMDSIRIFRLNHPGSSGGTDTYCSDVLPVRYLPSNPRMFVIEGMTFPDAREIWRTRLGYLLTIFVLALVPVAAVLTWAIHQMATVPALAILGVSPSD